LQRNGLSKNKLIKHTGRSGGLYSQELDKICCGYNRCSGRFKVEPSCFFGFNKCALDNPCAMHDVWVKSQEELIKVLKTTSLKDIKQRKDPN
jgi:DNA-binding IscR family transcriptional regulator